ncbi:MAG: hypothetical protein K2L59_01025 [Muribaculaceae bacterium]|nr:hypothetical protein [Muribaculaceae bacterium]MDE6382524.1 hypothetical protein [Muribaculaceae bacterium]MDE6391838.1 hypothetical protein [Muribaculaceae bacterium]
MKIHIGHAIRDELRRQERSVAWFARQICCTRPHVYRIFEKENIDVAMLHRVCRVLDHDFFKDISDSLEPRGAQA